MKKFEMNKKAIYIAAGAAIMVGSAIAIADYVVRRKNEKAYHVAELIAGIAGIALGAAVVAEPKRQELTETKLVMDDMFTEEDVALVDEQIRETLNGDIDRGVESKDHVRTIEVDNETSIEDFI